MLRLVVWLGRLFSRLIPLRSFEAERRSYLLAVLGIAGGLGIAGTFDAKAGGVIVVASWALAVFTLHRMGRAGSTPRT